MTQDRLINAAVESFAAKGFHGTTTRDIASAAGMSPAALYVHHKSKEELLYVISRTGHEQTLDVVTDAAASSDEPVQQLAAVMRAFASWHARNHTVSRIVNYELAALAPEHYDEIITIRRAIARELRFVVEKGVASGRFASSRPGMTANALLSLGVDIGRWYHESGEWTPDDIAEHYAEIALRMVGIADDIPEHTAQ